MSKKLSTLPRGSLSIKCLNLSRDLSMSRQNKTRDKVGIDCILWRVWNFVMSLVWYNDHRTFVRILFPKLWQKEYFQESSSYIKPSKYDNIYVLIEWWNFVRSQLMIQSLQFFNGTNFVKLLYCQMVMKLARVIMIKLLWNICTCVYTDGLDLSSEYLPAYCLNKIWNWVT